MNGIPLVSLPNQAASPPPALSSSTSPPPASPPPVSSPPATPASSSPASFRTASPGAQQLINLGSHGLHPNGSSVTVPHQTPSNPSTGNGFLTDSVLWTAICALGLFIFITLVTWKSGSLDWPLANLSITSGILLLAFVSKFTDWALEMLSGVGWEKLYWGFLLQHSNNLLTFLVVNSGLSAWWKVLVYAPKQSSQSSSRLVTLLKRPLLARWPQFWAFWRIMIWLLMQFPGLIIMSAVDTQTAYRPAGWSTVSGGLGIFNSSQAFQLPGDFVSNSYVFNILQNPTMSVRTNAITAECRGQETCESFLLVGGLKWIAPWPYGWLSDPNLTAYITRLMPVYQLEGWNTTFDKSVSWADNECRVYDSTSNAVQICAKESNKGGSILTGIRACDPGQLDDAGDCTLNPDWPGWDSFVAFSSTLSIHRLNTSIAADRRSSTILDVLDKGETHRQNIEPTHFLDAFDNLLCPFHPDNSSTTSRYCEIGQARSDLTNTLWSVVYSNYNVGAVESSLAVETLRNLFATALFLFNPVYRGAVLTSEPVFSRTAQAGLAEENYFPGSAARVSSRFHHLCFSGSGMCLFMLQAAQDFNIRSHKCICGQTG